MNVWRDTIVHQEYHWTHAFHVLVMDMLTVVIQPLEYVWTALVTLKETNASLVVLAILGQTAVSVPMDTTIMR